VVSEEKVYTDVKTMTDEDSSFVDIGDVHIHYKAVEGERKDADPLFLLHDISSGVFAWGGTWQHLLKHTSLLIGVDLPGFGLSDRPLGPWEEDSNPYREEFSVKIVITLLDRYKLPKVAIVGHGMGGALAIITAQRHPQRVSKVILVAPTIYRDYIPQSIQPFLSNTTLLKTYLSKIQEESFYDKKQVKQDRIEIYDKMLEVQNWDAGIQQINCLTKRFSVKAMLPLLECPVMILHGVEDNQVPVEDSQLAFKNLKTGPPTNRLELINQCGHLPQEEQPILFAEKVKEFLSD